MLIQPLVQSAGSATPFANSVSASGVEEAVVRAPIAPVQEPTNAAGANNELTRFQTPSVSTSPSGQTSSQASAVPGSAGASVQSTAGSDPHSQAAAKSEQQQADQVVLDQLKARDQVVHQHEAAHAAVGGQYAGAPSFQYQRGPDGHSYAVGGEVSIATAPVKGDPQATIAKARIIRAAALAPAQPSSQDQAVAAAASQMELKAEFQLQQQQTKARNTAAETKQIKAETNKEAANKEAARQADQKTASAEARAQAAARREEANKEYNKELQKEAAARSVNDSSPQTVNASQRGSRGVPTQSQSSAAGSSSTPSTKTDQQTQTQSNALDRLQKILLGPYDILVRANQKGLVNPNNPYGSSGLLNVFA